MTNEEAKNGFWEVYNVFWNKYKNNVPGIHSPEWDEIFQQATQLQEKYPFLKETVMQMMEELDQRARRE